jgi:hypothetical protein
MGLLGAIVAYVGWNWKELDDAPQVIYVYSFDFKNMNCFFRKCATSV